MNSAISEQGRCPGPSSDCDCRDCRPSDITTHSAETWLRERAQIHRNLGDDIDATQYEAAANEIEQLRDALEFAVDILCTIEGIDRTELRRRFEDFAHQLDRLTT